MASLSVTPEHKKERTDRAIAAIITILIHAGLLLLLLYYVIVTPIPPYPAPPGGPELELDFGNAVNGTGTVEAPNIGNKQSQDNKINQPSTTPTKANNPVVTNDVETTAPINSGKKVTNTPEKKDTVKPQPQISIELAGIDSKMKKMKGMSGGNGNSGQAGNAGGPNGITPGTSTGSGNGLGTGDGKGFSFNLNGRNLLHRPKLESNNPEQGQIVVGITVDQDGNVTEAIPGVKGSTITDESLYLLVKDAAMKIKFSKSSEDTPEQSGTVTFVFTIQ